MDNIDKIHLHLNKLKFYLKALKIYVGVTTEELTKDFDTQLKVDRLFELTIQSCVDIAQCLIVNKRYRFAEDSADAIRVLGERGVLDADFAESFSKMTGFRNILVHDYMDIDYEKVADNLNNHLDDFERFAKEVAKFLT